jgi:hypothetical protein
LPSGSISQRNRLGSVLVHLTTGLTQVETGDIIC